MARFLPWWMTKMSHLRTGPVGSFIADEKLFTPLDCPIRMENLVEFICIVKSFVPDAGCRLTIETEMDSIIPERT